MRASWKDRAARADARWTLAGRVPVMATAAATDPPGVDRLCHFVERHPRLFVLTGAGISTGSGIPDYRDDAGAWKRPAPVQLREFVGDPATRRRYWARSLAGWRDFARAAPNRAHRALARLETRGRIGLLVTQNVDRLHQRAGSRKVLDLHGRIDTVCCLGCGRRWPRGPFQQRLERLNPAFAGLTARTAPDGDADLEGVAFERFAVPDCSACGGLLKPDVVFFGENVPRARVERARAALEGCDALLVVGSSLMVFSGYRFCRAAAARGLPIAALNLGRTRADDLLALKVRADCAAVLERLAARIDPTTG